jgi:hypothetical protein
MGDLQRGFEDIVLPHSMDSSFISLHLITRHAYHLATSKSLPKVSYRVEQFHIIILLWSVRRSLRIRDVAFQRLDGLVVRTIESERLRRCHRLADSTHRRQSSIDEVCADVLCSAQGR